MIETKAEADPQDPTRVHFIFTIQVNQEFLQNLIETLKDTPGLARITMAHHEACREDGKPGWRLTLFPQAMIYVTKEMTPPQKMALIGKIALVSARFPREVVFRVAPEALTVPGEALLWPQPSSTSNSSASA